MTTPDLATEARRVAEYLNEYPRERGRTFAATINTASLRTVTRALSEFGRPVRPSDLVAYAEAPQVAVVSIAALVVAGHLGCMAEGGAE